LGIGRISGIDPYDLSRASGAVEHMFVAEREHQVLPVGLEDLPPGPEPTDVLASIDRSGLDGHDRVVDLQTRSRMIAHFQAELYADMVAIIEAEEERCMSSRRPRSSRARPP